MHHFDREATVHGAFARQASETPFATAVIECSRQYSYADIEQLSNRLARYLAIKGVGQGDRVALLAERSAGAVVAMLAVLKLGAAFVPLDPVYPHARLAAMLDDARPALVVGRAALAPAQGSRFIDLDQALAEAASLPGDTQPDVGGPGDAAYVMYTSGSTGRPKGVVVPHRAIVRLVRGQTYARFEADETFLHLAPLAFDASTFEIWGALLNGAKLGIVHETRPSVDDIVTAIAAYGATTAWFTAGLFHLLVDQRLDGLRPLRQILAGGDVLSPSHMQRARQALPHCRFVNGYGPTENTTFSCCHAIGTDDDGPIPIGRPIAHGTVHLLGDDLRPVAADQPGQLCVGGDGLALGYLNAPELTASKFVHVPAIGKRLYLTGDLARRRPDGAYEFLGRMDRQIKLDGKRVEIEEIETALRAEPGVADAAVVVCEGPAGARRLVAFLNATAGGSRDDIAAAGLGERLRRALPAYMVPSAFSVVDGFPLTTNGKIDRAKLAAAAPAALDAPVGVAPGAVPTAELEVTVGGVWAAVLGRAQVPRDVNFFDLGGTSLLLMNVHARLRALGLPNLPLVALFENPTIASLAARLGGDEPARDRLVDDPGVRGAARQAALQRFRRRSLERTL
ncbi:amino acid adenylation domain-containing protein [Chelatococcus reniformis]|uniref:Carrier domain-containing protein n=1 Tax=Chelatococcus reniformis TaxID=1494448 RepID=A0A916UHC0_9HYPH|nr:amino acid adenylation domain-containing protein [Chelatococcus reniformis]GGC72379.1 hypothetical protein GCM10010994_33480 [Chelatococcus reniformis]